VRTSVAILLLLLLAARSFADSTCEAWLRKSHKEKVLSLAEGNQIVLDVLLHAKRRLIEKRSAVENLETIDRQIAAMLACQQRETPKLIATWDAICHSQENTLANLEAARGRYAQICTQETVAEMPR
jgi:hypothetical protein